MKQPFEADVLRLVPLDKARMQALCEGSLDAVCDFTVEDSAADDAHLKAAYREMLRACSAHPETEIWYTNWQIVLLCENRSIGSLAFFGAPDENATVTLGYGIDEGYRRRGFGTKAVLLACRWAFENGARSILAETEADNLSSIRLLEKCGFCRCGQGEEGPLFRLTPEHAAQ